MSPSRSKPTEPLHLFRSHLEEVRVEVDSRLSRLWDATVANLSRHGDAPRQMAEAARDLTVRGGKRFRAGMLVATFSGLAPRASKEPAFDAAVALELLQTYLLIQDDWMDGDALRRGGPSAHAALTAQFGDAHLGACSAILAGDLTWGLAIRALAGAKVKADRKLRALDLLCGVHEDVIVGQQLDMLGRAQDVEAMHSLKTGSYTVRGPLVLGATLAGASKRAVAAFGKYAEPLGVAFQLRDDLLGAFGKEADTGKREGSDLRAGKRTAVVAAAEPLLSDVQRAAFEKAFGQADASPEDVRAATAALSDSGGRQQVEERLTDLCGQADTLAYALPISDKSRHIFAGAARALLPPKASA